MDEGGKELNSILIGIMYGLGLPKVRIMLNMAIITAYNLQETMVAWLATYHGKEDSLTAQIFTSKLNELTETK